MAKKIDKGVMTAEERKKITDGLKQWWASRATPEHRESARKRFSKPKSEEHKKKISDSCKVAERKPRAPRPPRPPRPPGPKPLVKKIKSIFDISVTPVRVKKSARELYDK